MSWDKQFAAFIVALPQLGISNGSFTIPQFHNSLVKPGFHMIVTVGDASPRQARGHTGDSCVKCADVADQTGDSTGTVRGRIKRAEMSLKRGFHVIVKVIVSICFLLIGDTSPMCRSRSPTVTIIWKPGLRSTLENL